MVAADSYKAALNNPKISDSAKEHARQQLQLLKEYDDDQKNEHNNRVLGGVLKIIYRNMLSLLMVTRVQSYIAQ